MKKLFEFLGKLANSIHEIEQQGNVVQSISINQTSHTWLCEKAEEAGLGDFSQAIWTIPLKINQSLPDGETVLHF